MKLTRRRFLQTGSLLPVVGAGKTGRLQPDPVLKPPRLKPGDTVGIVSPASATFDPVRIDIIEERMAALGLQSKRGTHVLDRRGYFAGPDADRAADVNAMFADSEIQGICAVTGGWGCARILPLLDYDTIRQNPKPLFGYSDVTALLIGIYAKTGLVTFHGPNGDSASWNAFTVDHFKPVVMEAEAVVMRNPSRREGDLAQLTDRVRTLTSGMAQGRLVGGNLTVLTSIIGSDYLPTWDGHLLFLEDIGEDIYRMDRMLMQLKLAGVLDRISGFVFGKCTDCESDSGGYGGLTLDEVFRDHIMPLDIPAWHGAMIGHIRDKFTVPVGIRAEIDADAGTITLLEPAVT